VRERISSPPATAAPVAPTATAGPLALPATSRTVPTKPFEPLLGLGALRLRLALLRLALVPLREVRAFAPDELARARLRDPELLDDLPLAFDAVPLDDLLLLCLLPEDLPLAATAHPSSVLGHSSLSYPPEPPPIRIRWLT
jgi:hypothetical protein